MKTIVSASLLSADFAELGREVRRAENAAADWIHFDVMDGMFVPSISFGEPVLKSVSQLTSLPLDVHLMICDPIRYVSRYAKLGASYITFHLEAADSPAQVISAIHDCGAKAGISIKPSTDAREVFEYLDIVDMILVMTVEPGFGGQSFMDGMLRKIRIIREECDRRGLDMLIETDGGINEKTASLVRENGCNVLVSGSYLFGAEDMKSAVDSLR